MFNNNSKQTKKTSTSSNKNDKNLPSVNMISEGTILEGTLKVKSDIRIAGTIKGEANADGKVIVSSTGTIKGNIKAVDADIAGKIDGEIKVTNKLVLRKSALVEGDIYTKTLLVEEGAQINGEFRMTESSTDHSGNGKAKTNGFSGKASSQDKKEENMEKEKVNQ